MEKSSKVFLTSGEMDEIRNGSLPQRISQNYQLTLAELLDIIRYDQYEIIGENTHG